MRTSQGESLRKSSLNKDEFWVPVRRGSIQLCDTTTVVASDKSLGKRNSLVATMLRFTSEDDSLIVARSRPASTYISFPHFDDDTDQANSEAQVAIVEVRSSKDQGLTSWLQKISMK
ncbi:hypothetical protein K493DRAFT_358238 [Basidiobolus meristosporus CBS 931.73]|uniref:Uncharacterized protein n=1 Tax=Basidiobolus meristosporus CBS 931.73 TaxID=1314790 RepID=A0A1Y1XUM0_9FUNG|nr:hypothetical protein K493DRAFT_358238 [Basidiobolus meristosporus CBS 931.73]|eukprot:ORX89375.1 hypothetical protein K493DRAFT_358238 [Basidiobolus meristosporus CBS 931.73]